MTISLYKNGQRLYLTQEERQVFLDAAATLPPMERTLCETLAITGCRISEALKLTTASVDVSGEEVVIETLKKRKEGVFRVVPVSADYIALMAETHSLPGPPKTKIPLWTWHRTKAWLIVKAVFEKVGISGPWATPKGLRHGFAVNAVLCDIPPNLIQKWMGHADLKTTCIYLQIISNEERKFAARMWPRSKGT